MFDKKNVLSKYLDTTNLTSKEVDIMQTLAKTIRDQHRPYCSLGRASLRFGLNADNKVTSFRMCWRYMSLKPVPKELYDTRRPDVDKDSVGT